MEYYGGDYSHLRDFSIFHFLFQVKKIRRSNRRYSTCVPSASTVWRSVSTCNQQNVISKSSNTSLQRNSRIGSSGARSWVFCTPHLVPLFVALTKPESFSSKILWKNGWMERRPKSNFLQRIKVVQWLFEVYYKTSDYREFPNYLTVCKVDWGSEILPFEIWKHFYAGWS